MKKLLPIYLLSILSVLFIFDCSAKITINSVQVTTSTCPNNGTATVFASSTSDTAVFLYNIVSGPVTSPLQNDSIFKSLYPGTYTVRVHDVNSYDSTQTTFTIVGTYRSLAASAVVNAPLCINGNQGSVVVNPNGTGLGPYTWQVISPYTGTSQANDTLRNLPPGQYQIKVTDACFNAVTEGAVVDSSGMGFELTFFGLGFMGCDTVSLQFGFIINSALGDFPLKISYTTKSGTQVHHKIPGGPPFQGQYYINDTIDNVAFDQPLHVCFTDTCQNNYCITRDSLTPFVFYTTSYQSSSGCVSGFGETLNYGFQHNTDTNLILTYPGALPLTVTLTDSLTGMVVDSTVGTCCGNFPPQTSGRTYIVKVKDNCGDSFRTSLVWPAGAAASLYAEDYYRGSCIDSTGSAVFYWSGMGSGLTIKLLTGPSHVRSTKPEFSYYDTLTYPYTYTNIPNTGAYYIAELPAGNYTYQGFDSCGNTFNGAFTISYVSSLLADYSYTTTCGGINNITVALGNGYTEFGIYIHAPIKSEDIGGSPQASFSFPDFPIANYITQTTFNNYPGTVPIPGLPVCAVVNSNLNIVAVNDSTLSATDVVSCKGDIYIRLDADSNNGVLPFQYEIINGPETFAPQNSNLFTVHTFGTYVVGVVDSCGNVDAREISIDTGRFTPVVRSGGWCPGSQVQLTETYSPYYNYIWLKPDGTTYTGDTLVINPFTRADTGMYYISKIVNINGCTDSAFGQYHLVFQDTFHQTIALCAGDTLRVGSSSYFLPGMYTDSMTGAYGCDSIELTNLTLRSSGTVTVSPASPPPCHTGSTHLTASGGTTYRWYPGNYTTDTITVSPSIVTVYTVFADENLECSATATVTVYPSGNSSITITSDKTIFCANDSAELCAPEGFTTYQWSGGITATTNCVYVHDAGDYYVMASDGSSCNASSNHLAINVYPVPSVSIIVLGDTLSTYGQVDYQWLHNDSIIPGAVHTVYVAPQRGLYSLLVTDTNGCTTISNPVDVTGISSLSFGDGSGVRIYPNPSAGTWQLTVDNSLVGSALEVYDDEERLVFKSEIRNLKSEITTANTLPSGIYYLRISNKNTSIVKMLVKI